MSSFRRKPPSVSSSSAGDTINGASAMVPGMIQPAPVVSIGTGIKPTLHNSLGMVSSGHSQLDDLLGGGLQLGTTLLIGTDLYSHYGETLLSYGVAESLSMKQRCLLLTANKASADTLISSLPYNRVLGDNVDSKKSKYCCSYDLSRPLQSSLLESSSNTDTYTDTATVKDKNKGRLSIYYGATDTDTDTDADTPTTATATVDSIIDGYIAAVKAFVDRVESGNDIGNSYNNRGNAGRVFLCGLHEILAQVAATATAAATAGVGDDAHRAPRPPPSPSSLLYIGRNLLLRIKMICRSSRVVAVCSAMPEALPGAAKDSCSEQHRLGSNSTEGGTVSTILEPLLLVADSAITIDSFAGKLELVPYEFQEFCGFLVIERIQHIGTLVPYRPRALRFGLKRDRRKLHIEPLHLPPEESRAQGSAGTDARLEARSKIKKEQEAEAAPAPVQAKVSEPIPLPIATTTLTPYPADTTAATAATAATAPPRQYKRLNFGASRPPGPISGVSISSNYKKTTTKQSAVVAGTTCGTGPSKDTRLEF